MKLLRVILPYILTMTICLSAYSKPNISLKEFQKLKKAELHLHLGGSFPFSYLKTLANEKQQEVLDTILKKYQNTINYDECFEIFKIISSLVNTDEKIKLGTKALCEDLEKDGVEYAEIRTGLKDLGNGYESYLNAVIDGISLANTSKLETKLLLSLQRSSRLEMAKTTVDLAIKYKSLGVIGIDISDHSAVGDISQIEKEILRAKDHGLFLALHMGECEREKNQLKLLETLTPDRIGHGVFLEEPAKQWILKNKVPIEVCLSSAVCVKMVKKLSDHPGLLYFKKYNHPICICTDDPTVFFSSLSLELKKLYDESDLSFEDIVKITENAFEQKF